MRAKPRVGTRKQNKGMTKLRKRMEQTMSSTLRHQISRLERRPSIELIAAWTRGLSQPLFSPSFVMRHFGDAPVFGVCFNGVRLCRTIKRDLVAATISIAGHNRLIHSTVRRFS